MTSAQQWEDDEAWIADNWPTAPDVCVCYDPPSMEYDIEPCDHCKRQESVA